ncbi:MAG: UvrD-helicase domain-containing protein, partial [Parvularculaceae bacterium]
MNAPRALAECIAAQRLAADPRRSAFVAANAGAGKTSVLTDRVARLLLSGAEPRRILCITFTKAAAAEMARRLFELLGRWALAEDAALNKALDDLEGAAISRDPGALATARRLFAKALETPGGLKIQTIHSFCEGLLKRFPLEAGAPPGFAVIDESAAAGLARTAIDEAAVQSAQDETLAAAFARLALRLQPESARDGAQKTLRSLIADALASRGKLEDALAAAGAWDGLRDAVGAALGVRPGETAEAIVAATMATVSEDDIKRLQSALRAGEKVCRGFADNELAGYIAAGEQRVRFDVLGGVLLTQKGTPRQRFPDAATKKADPWAEAYVSTLQASFAAASERIKAADNFADTAALLAILERALAAYDDLKARRAVLDYDDLIARAHILFAKADLDWVRYKLDQGLDHILLDEAQDTSPAQWKVVEGPLGEFFAGAGARDGERTFFAVGDQKQSIYSFQGADAGLFKEKREDLGKKITAVAPFDNVALNLSFRSTAPVLDFVDALFAKKEVLAGVSDEHPLKHQLYRTGEAGLVEFWPLAPRAEKKETRAWEAPLDSTPPDNPARRLALEVASKIKAWIETGEVLVSKGRPIRPGDVMILVQSRGPLFHEMIRALTEKSVPVAGADKLKLLEDAAVEDLLSYARAALLEEDDLSLAEVLKSPFFNID